MRKPILLLLLALPACDDGASEPEVLIPAFREKAARLTCELVDLGVAAAPTEIRLGADSMWTLLDGPNLEVLRFTDGFDLVSRTRIPDHGPGAAKHPVSAGFIGDSVVVVAARDGLRLVFLSAEGEFLRYEPLDFIPNVLAVSASGDVLVTPLPYGTRPPSLLMRYTAGDWEALAVPKRSYPDMSITAIGNSALVEALPGGGALVMHQFIRPQAFRVDSTGRVEALMPPTPDVSRAQIGYVPTAPITDREIARMLVPAIAMTVDPGTEHVYVLTRAGPYPGDLDSAPAERALLHLDERLEFLRGYILPVRAGGMVFLPRRRTVLVVDETDGLHVCPLPSGPPA